MSLLCGVLFFSSVTFYFQERHAKRKTSTMTKYRTKLLIIASLLYVLTSPIHTLPAKTVTPFSKSVRRLELVTKKILSQFISVFNESSEAAGSTDDYLVYRCDDLCVNDRHYFHGVSSGFLLASMMKRQFKIVTSRPSVDSIFEFYETNGFNWKSNDVLKFTGMKTKPIIAEVIPNDRPTEVFSLARDMLTMNFKSEYPDELVYSTGNDDFLRDLRRHTIVTEQFPWMGTATNNDVVRLIHTGLFRIPHEWQVDLYKTVSDQMGNNTLLCYYGNEDGHTIENAASVLKLIESYGNNVKLYMQATETERLLLLNELDDKIISLDNLESRRNVKNSGLSSFEFMISIELGKLCDVLMTTHNQEGVLAAILRSTSKHLYCIGHNGDLYSCTREGITGAFRDDISFTPNKAYLRTKYKHKRSGLFMSL